MTKDIPAGVIAVGNPCKVKRKITDKDMFDTVQELLEANSKVVQKNPSHCLVGKLFCESCKQRMAHSYRGRPKYYCKTRYYESDNTGCVTSVLDETLEQIQSHPGKSNRCTEDFSGAGGSENASHQSV